MIRMFTGLVSLVFRRRKKLDPDAIFQAGRTAGLTEAPAPQLVAEIFQAGHNAGLAEASASAQLLAEEEAAQKIRRPRGVHGDHDMPEERARFIVAFLKRAFRNRTAISIFCHEDRSFPDIRAGGKVEDAKVYESGKGWGVTFDLNHYIWFMDGDVDIELERITPMLRVETFTPSGAAIRLVFKLEGGYRDDYELWAKARRALDREEYFEFEHE